MNKKPSLLKVVSITNTITKNNFVGKIVEFVEIEKDGKPIISGRYATRIIWDKRTSILLKNLETNEMKVEDWEGDTLFLIIKFGSKVVGEIETFWRENDEIFNAVIFKGEVDRIGIATKQLLYQTRDNTLRDANSKRFKYLSKIEIL